MEPTSGPRRAWRRTIAIALVVAAGGLAPGITTAAWAENLAGGACQDSGTLIATPGLTTSPQQVTFTLSGSLSACRMSDASIESGSFTGSASAYASCAGGSGEDSGTITWNTGKKTAIRETLDIITGPVVIITGKVTGGDFAGAQTGGVLVAMVADPSACASSAGVTEVAFQGVFAIGGP